MTPAKKLDNYKTTFPKVFEDFDKAKNRLADRRVFLSLSAALEEVKTKPYAPLIFSNIQNLVDGLTLYTWSKTKGIYRFNEQVYNEVVKTKLDTVPTSLLTQLPAWCVFVQVPHDSIMTGSVPIQGFWAYLDKKDNEYIMQFLMLDTKGRTGLQFISLKHDTIEENLSEYYSQLDKDGKEQISQLLEVFVKLTAYLCSAEADIVQAVAEKPKARRTALIPERPIQWAVGERIGAALLRYKKEYAKSESESNSESGIKVRPHVRKAHWHHYWTGEGKTSLVCKWLPPIPVGWDWNNELPTVIRNVK